MSVVHGHDSEIFNFHVFVMFYAGVYIDIVYPPPPMFAWYCSISRDYKKDMYYLVWRACPEGMKSSKKHPPRETQAVLSRMQLALQSTRPPRHGASLWAEAINVCLVGENPTCSVPAL